MMNNQDFYITREAIIHLRVAQEYLDKLAPQHVEYLALGDAVQDVIEALEFIEVTE